MNSEETQDGVSQKKNFARVIGFVLALIFFACGLTSIPALFFLLLIGISERGLIGFLFACTLIASPVLVVCIIDIFRKRGRVLSLIGLSLTLCCAFIVLPLRFITFTAPGSLFYPLNIYKFRRACECDFWLEYDKPHMVNVESQNTFIFWGCGSIHFKAEPGTYKDEQIISYAERHGWIYHMKLNLQKEVFTEYEAGSFDGVLEDWEEVFYYLKAYNDSPLWIKEDCVLLVFETGNIHGIASYVMITKDGSEMVVRYNNQSPPDPPRDFWLPPAFEKLSG